ncbi:MAG TPA: (d)CMP kinase [Clostridiaceae bacterium]|nr:(d)CMP kinase [Clostridiaceae bacterium]
MEECLLSTINIAIDGPAGAGKSTVAKAVAKEMGIVYLDTGAMYRAVALKAIQEGIDTLDEEKLSKMVSNIDIKISYSNNEQKIFLDGKDVSEDIRTPQASIGASNVATIPAVRLKMVELQRNFALNNSMVMDGRDIGTYVLPNADYKFFLTASVEERARRRYKEQIDKGIKNVSFQEILEDINYRDKNDSSRKFAPLKKAPDAIEIDTTNMSISDVVNKILSIVRK